MKLSTGIVTLLAIVFTAFLMTGTCFSDDWNTSTQGEIKTQDIHTKVGIGTSTPGAKLEVGVPHAVNQNEEMRIGSYSADEFYGLGFNYRLDHAGLHSRHLVEHWGPFKYDSMSFKRGNVGIGTTAPQEKLEVGGNIKINGNIVSDGDICIGNCN